MICELGMWVSPGFFWPQPYDHCEWYGDQHGADATCNNHQPSTATQNHNPCWYSWSDSDYQRFHHHVSDLNSWRQEHLWLRILLHLGSRWPCHPVETTISRCEELLGCSLTREPGTILCKLCWSPRYPSCIQLQRFCLRSSFCGLAFSFCQNIRGTSRISWAPDCFFSHWFGWGPYTQDQALPRMLTMEIFSRPTEPYMAWRKNWCPFEHQYPYLHDISAMSWLGCILQSSNLSVCDVSRVQWGQCRKLRVVLFLIPHLPGEGC